MNFKKIILCNFVILISIGLICCSFIKFMEPTNIIKESPIPQYILDDIVKNYVEPISIVPSYGGKPFCDYMIIDSEKKENTIKIYLWLLAQEYFVEGNKLFDGTGGEFSAILIIEKENDNYKFIDCNISKAIDQEESLKIFPQSIRKKANENCTFNDSSLIKLKKDAETYFND